MKKRILSIALSLCMVLMLVPMTVLAEGDDTQELQTLLNDGGTVKLEKDYTITSSLQVDNKTVTLDLNGHVIKKNSNGDVIKVIKGANLTLQDSSPKTVHTGEYVSLPAGGVITKNKPFTGSGMYVDGSSFTMNGGTISDCFTDGGGGGVRVRNKGSFIMNNGAISSCFAGGGGGGIELAPYSSFTMNGGTISDCRGTDGGVAANAETTIYANGGSIMDKFTVFDSSIENTAIYGGTVFYGGISIFSSCTIIGKTITFEKDDKPYAIEIVAEGNKAAKPIEPTKEGCEFAGWYDENDTEYDFTQNVTENITLAAHWESVEAPIITGLENGKTYCDAVEFEVTDNVGVASVTAGGVELSPTNGKYTLAKGVGTVTVVATDNADNETSVTVTVNDGHTGGEATCTKKAECVICGKEYGELDLDNHSLKHTAAKEATASETGNIEYWQCIDCEKYFLDEEGTKEIQFEDTIVSKKAPEIIKGKGQSVNQGEKKELSFTSNASYDDFKYVKLDGNELDPKNYTVKEGSTIVTLDKDFVSTLKAGKHTIGIVSETGEASTEFTVNKKTSVIKPSSDKNTTNTGLISNIGLWISLMFTSLDAMIIGFVLNKKRRS
ncbi:MAG: InlB B-repeat-containing protein [Erysipelotrichaceae bacterium]|nr:InlB B-repeat-containing protein [Erysipelotrichaceae bacterium]